MVYYTTLLLKNYIPQIFNLLDLLLSSRNSLNNTRSIIYFLMKFYKTKRQNTEIFDNTCTLNRVNGDLKSLKRAGERTRNLMTQNSYCGSWIGECTTQMSDYARDCFEVVILDVGLLSKGDQEFGDRRISRQLVPRNLSHNKLHSQLEN